MARPHLALWVIWGKEYALTVECLLQMCSQGVTNVYTQHKSLMYSVVDSLIKGTASRQQMALKLNANGHFVAARLNVVFGGSVVPCTRFSGQSETPVG